MHSGLVWTKCTKRTFNIVPNGYFIRKKLGCEHVYCILLIGQFVHPVGGEGIG